MSDERDNYKGMSDYDVVSGHRPTDTPEMLRRLKDAVVAEEQATRALTRTLVGLTWALAAFTAAILVVGVIQIVLLVRH